MSPPKDHVPTSRVSLQGMQNTDRGLALAIAVRHGLAVRLGIPDPLGNLFGRTGNLGRRRHSLVGHAATPADGQLTVRAQYGSGRGRRRDKPVADMRIQCSGLTAGRVQVCGTPWPRIGVTATRGSHCSSTGTRWPPSGGSGSGPYEGSTLQSPEVRDRPRDS